MDNDHGNFFRKIENINVKTDLLSLPGNSAFHYNPFSPF